MNWKITWIELCKIWNMFYERVLRAFCGVLRQVFLADVLLIRVCRPSCVEADFSRFYFEVVSKYMLMCEHIPKTITVQS